MNFEETVDFLIDSGFSVEEVKYAKAVRAINGWEFSRLDGFDYATLKGKGCVVMVTNEKGFNPAIKADNIRSFNKWGQCPLDLKLPRNEKIGRRLLKMLDHLGTQEGYQLSTTFAYLDDHPYHYQLRRWRDQPAVKIRRR